MKKYSIQKSEVQNDLLYLALTPVDPKDQLEFLSGQYVTIGFTGQNGRPSPVRCFSIVSAPNSGILEFALRIQGQFTQALSRLPLGAIVSIQGPFGSFVINPNSSKGAILLAGGIGITPFVSIIRSAAQNQSSTPLTLLFGCKNQDDVPFFAELLSLEQQNKHFKVGFFVAEGPIDKMAGARVYQGRITGEWLGRVTGGNYQNFNYYLCGPKGFMVGLTEFILAKGVNDLSIFSESFSLTSKIRMNDRYSVKSFVYRTTVWSLVVVLFVVAILDLKQSLPKLLFAQSSASPTAIDSTNQSVSTSSNDNSAAVTQTPSNDNSASYTPTPTYNYTSPSTSQPSGSYQMPRTMMS